MANNWRFFQDTGLSGGTANPADNTMYIDSYNGSDIAGDGSHSNPFKTIQKALDESASGGADFILCGVFDETGFVNVRTSGSIICEGRVTLKGGTGGVFTPFTRLGINHDAFAGSMIRNYGVAVFDSFTGEIGSSSGSVPLSYQGFWNCEFYSCLHVGRNATYMGDLVNCLMVDSRVGGVGYTYFSASAADTMINCTFINTSFRCRFFHGLIRNCYFDSTCTLTWILNSGTPDWDFNHMEGTLAGRLVFSVGTYADTAAFNAANPTQAVNDISHLVGPQFTDSSNEDYTLQPSSPLIKAGYDKGPIGCYNLGGDITTNSGLFDYVNIDTGTTQEITLIASGEGTATTKTLKHHQIADKKRLITKTTSPNLEQNFGLGEVMGSNVASGNTPTMTDIEIQYSSADNLTDDVDGMATYNGTWLRVPVGVQPFHDTVNDVGNDDPLFDVNNAVPIKAKYVKLRITLRSNEEQI